MKAEIIEIVKKTRKDFSISITKSGKSVRNIVLKGDLIWQQLDNFFLNENDILNQVTVLKVTNFNNSLNYISEFKNLKELHISSSIILEFPDLKQLINLYLVTINQQSKPTMLKNISSIPNLKELQIGNFTFSKPVELINIDEIIKCKTIEKLYFGNIKIRDSEIRKLAKMTSIKELVLSQKIDVDTLAFLSTYLINTKSNELKAWQECDCYGGNIKINGKRRPFLWKEKDEEKILKYEEKFEQLKVKYEKNK